jgi:1-hydroxy-2-naphthoate dioxygenase
MNANRSEEPTSLEEFNGELAQSHLKGQWTFAEALADATRGPTSYGIPYVWKWADVHPKLLEACVRLPESYAGRRNLSFRNPGTPMGAATRTLSIGMQIVIPGEVAWSHRHSIGAIRFAIEGSESLYTVVDGEKLAMEPGDLVLTPAHTWHDHHNESDRNGIWLDVLDTPLVFTLNQTFYEAFGETTQPVRERAVDLVSERGGWLRPAWEAPPGVDMPFRYPWREVRAKLDQLRDAEGSPYDGVLLRYANPVTGGPTLPTMDCYVQLLKAGLTTQKHRQTSSAVYYVVEGEGTTLVGDRELNWSARDCFAVPNWLWHQHINRSRTQDAVLFCCSDQPMLQALNLYREEPTSSVHSQPLPPVPANVARARSRTK